MAKPKRDEYVVNVSFRLFGDEGRRWDDVFDRAQKVDKKANKTDVVRSLLNLPPDDEKKPRLLSDLDRAYFADPNVESEMAFFRNYLALSPTKRATLREAVVMLRSVPEPDGARKSLVIRIDEVKRKKVS